MFTEDFEAFDDMSLKEKKDFVLNLVGEFLDDYDIIEYINDNSISVHDEEEFSDIVDEHLTEKDVGNLLICEDCDKYTYDNSKMIDDFYHGDFNLKEFIEQFGVDEIEKIIKELKK